MVHWEGCDHIKENPSLQESTFASPHIVVSLLKQILENIEKEESWTWIQAKNISELKFSDDFPYSQEQIKEIIKELPKISDLKT